MKVFGFLRDRTPMVRVVFPDGKTVEGPMLQILTRADVLKKL